VAIYVIRHGETASNADRIVQTPDIPLNERGQDQARRLALRLAEARIALICSSDLVRAAMTAEALARATGAPLEYDPGLQERNYGDLRGRSYREIGADIFADDFAPPGGETWPEFHARVDSAWARAVDRAREIDGDLALVTHGLFCRSLTRLLGLPAGPEAPRVFRNTSVTLVEAAPPHAVRLLDCAAHLDAAPAAEPARGQV
jgi:2,3-bisphosphoglycerate-dependent phosphoglycerate mutase